MNKLKENIKREFTGWKKWEIFWMIFANAMILGISIYNGDTVLSITASVTGVICVILCGMGNRIMRTETAATVAGSIILNHIGALK